MNPLHFHRGLHRMARNRKSEDWDTSVLLSSIAEFFCQKKIELDCKQNMFNDLSDAQKAYLILFRKCFLEVTNFIYCAFCHRTFIYYIANFRFDTQTSTFSSLIFILSFFFPPPTITQKKIINNSVIVLPKFLLHPCAQILYIFQQL